MRVPAGVTHCPKCSSKLTMLFTGAVCDACDPPPGKVSSLTLALAAMRKGYLGTERELVGLTPSSTDFQQLGLRCDFVLLLDAHSDVYTWKAQPPYPAGLSRGAVTRVPRQLHDYLRCRSFQYVPGDPTSDALQAHYGDPHYNPAHLGFKIAFFCFLQVAP